jgi:hypothetical protein
MQIYIKTPRNTISLQVDPTYSISKLKKILCDREGIPITEQRLIYAGKQLEDTKTLAYYAIQRESTLYLMTRLRGGAGLSISFNGDFSFTLSSAGLLTAQVTGTYSGGSANENNFILKNRLTDSTTESVPGVDRSYENDYSREGTFRITFTVTVTDIGFVTYFKQLIRYIFYIETVNAQTLATTPEITKYLFIPNSSSNILMTENNIKSITTVNISSGYKSVMLPPITSTVTRGTILHFKVTDKTNPYVLQIMPYFSVTVPTVYTFYNTLPTFDSTIDFNTDTAVFTSAILKLDTTNSVISLISNGSSDWKILNYYTDSLSIAVQNSATPLPESRVEITSQNVVLYYTDSIETICIFPSSQSYYVIRYLTILNTTGSSKTYTIFFSQFESVDGVISSGDGWCFTSLTLSANSIRSIMFVRTPSGYLILGTASYSGVSVSSDARGETAYTLLSKNITFSPADVGQRDCEVPAEPTLTTGTSKLCIVKGRRNSVTTTTTNIYTPVNDASSKIIFDGNNNTSITFNQEYSSALWLSVFYTTTTNILPINFYTGTGPGFTSYPVISGGGGGGGGPGGFD